MNQFRVFPLPFIARRLSRYAKVRVPECAGRFVPLDLGFLEKTLFNGGPARSLEVDIQLTPEGAQIEFDYPNETQAFLKKAAEALRFETRDSSLFVSRPTLTSTEMFKDAGLSLLLVEDNLEIGRLLHRAAQRAGLHCHWCTSAREAVHYSAPFDMLVSDLRLAECTGAQLVTRMQNLGYQGPVLLISGESDKLLERAATEAGPRAGFLQKPFDLVDFFHHLSILLSGERPNAGLPT